MTKTPSQVLREAADILRKCEQTYSDTEKAYHNFRTTEGRKLRERAYENLQRAQKAYRQLVHK